MADKQTVVISKYISLNTPEKLSDSEKAMWVDIIKDYGPANIVDSTQIYSTAGRKDIDVLSKTLEDGSSVTAVPLKRDLVEEEVSAIFDAWLAYFEKDFDLEVSGPEHDVERSQDGEVDEECDPEYDMFAEELAKLRHSNHIRSLQESGWRYGAAYNKQDKTHPQMMPWEQLPEGYKNVDYQFAEDVVGLIERMGYVVTKAD